MSRQKLTKITLRSVVGVVVLALIAFGVAMLPGKIEGNYRNLGATCMCDSVNFMQFHDGKVMLYKSKHPPAILIGYYEANADNSVSIYLNAIKKRESDTLLATATPRLWHTKFTVMGTDGPEWHRKMGNSETVETIEPKPP